MKIIIIIIIISLIWEFFHTSVSWWLFTGVWVTVSLLKSQGFSSVLLLYLIFSFILGFLQFFTGLLTKT